MKSLNSEGTVRWEKTDWIQIKVLTVLTLSRDERVTRCMPVTQARVHGDPRVSVVM